jgi:hypothetical protein
VRFFGGRGPRWPLVRRAESGGQGREGRQDWRKPGVRLAIIPLLTGWERKVAKIAKFWWVGFGDVVCRCAAEIKRSRDQERGTELRWTAEGGQGHEVAAGWGRGPRLRGSGCGCGFGADNVAVSGLPVEGGQEGQD